MGSHRYIVNISFNQPLSIGSPKIDPIAEPVKTLKEAQSYRTLLDETVKKACIVDNVTKKIVEWWVK